MTTATAQASANIAFAKLSQENTIFGDRKTGIAHRQVQTKTNLSKN
jgi:hypothetical protein